MRKREVWAGMGVAMGIGKVSEGKEVNGRAVTGVYGWWEEQQQ